MATYERLAKIYDDAIGMDETMMGMLLLRRFLVSGHAKGDVLEVAAGTGRNLPYYGTACTSLTVTDASKAMLEVAVDVGKQKSCAVPIGLAVKTKAEDLSAALNGRQFDTVVDTFGLCSFDDPVEALRQMQACCKKDGTILLLEHGRSSWLPWLTNILDKQAVEHAAKWGCVWNRDIKSIVEASCLEVISLDTYHFGTTYYIVGRPGRSSAHNERTAVMATSISEAPAGGHSHSCVGSCSCSCR